MLQIRRRTESLNVTVPLGPLGIETRPELPPAAVKLYKEGKLTLAAKSAADPWLYNRLGETLETQRQAGRSVPLLPSRMVSISLDLILSCRCEANCHSVR